MFAVYTQILTIALLAIVNNVNAHGYCYSPISRNFLATTYNPSNPGGIGKWWVSHSDPSYSTTPYPENCPHCLNRKPADGFCGYDDRSRNYDSPKNFEGKPLKIETHSTYTKGDEIEIESVLTAHHMGHIQVGGCPADALSDDCFNSNLLIFVEDLSDYDTKANVDTLHPERAHVHPAVGIGTDSSTTASGSMRFKHKFRLPENLVGNHVVLQWRYLTANSCNHPDYELYEWPADSWWSSALAQCVVPLSKTGDGAPEQFWNCLDVKVRFN